MTSITNKVLEEVDYKIYIVHGISGYEDREKWLEQHLKIENNLEYNLITESPDSEQNEYWIKKYFSDNIRDLLSKGGIFCTLVHILCYEAFLKSNHRYAIIFENDICLFSNFNFKIKKIFKDADLLEPGFFISLENSTLRFPSLWKTRRGKYLYPADSGRCAGAYIIDRLGAENILLDLKQNKCREVIDFWHNDLIRNHIVRMYWSHPPIAEQGSSSGKFKSSSSTKDNGNIRYIRWMVQKLYKMYILRLFKF
jgi:glycosyl transferase family 25